MEDLFPRLYRNNKNLQGDRIGEYSVELSANWAGSFRNAAFLLSPMLGLGLFIHAAASESPKTSNLTIDLTGILSSVCYW